MSHQYHHHVTTCSDAFVALNLVRQKRDSFDLVVSGVHTSNTDDYKFLRFIDQEFKVPAVMMSVDDSSRSVLEGNRHGTCLTKPIHQDDIKNTWQNVVRKKTQNHNKEHEVAGVNIKGDAEYTCSIIGATIVQNTKKKPRFVWNNECHKQFVNAVVQLGNEAVPKKIMKLMNIPDLTREHVASHLQKFRLRLKRKSNETKQIHSLMVADSSSSLEYVANASTNVTPQTQAGLCIAGNINNFHCRSNNYLYSPLMVVDDESSLGYVGWNQSDELMEQIPQQQQIVMQEYHNQSLPYYDNGFI